MKVDLKQFEWKRDSEKEESLVDLNTILKNKSSSKKDFKIKEKIEVRDKDIKYVRVKFEGKIYEGSGATLYLNNFEIPIQSEINMFLEPPIDLSFSMRVMEYTEIEISKIELELLTRESDLIEETNDKGDVLVISPNYPTPDNLYLCGFVHARVREYVNAGMKVDVAAIDDSYWYQTQYKIDGVRVFKGKYSDLKTLIGEGRYKVIVVHFVGEKCFQVLDGYRTSEKLVFINHGAEMLFDYLPTMGRPYFAYPLTITPAEQELFEIKRRYIKKYAKDPNSTWVFVSEFLQKESEKLIDTHFNNATVIHNVINEKLFPYKPKTEEQRKNILIIRKFDNLEVHAIDQSILAILELSRRECFKDLTFNIYGDGNFFAELIEPIKNLKNVNINKRFLTHEQISKVHEENGILLLPSRFDTQGVSMGEGASSGLVVVGTNTAAVGDFMEPEINHTLAELENPKELADIIERLYNNPKEFLEISKRMATKMHHKCGIESTIKKEIKVIQDAIKTYKNQVPFIGAESNGEKILTIAVPSYNIEKYIDKCLFSLLNHRNAYKTEILMINDGSTDRTKELATAYEQRYPRIIRVINKENGGHGSTINVGIKEAKGKYFRIIDGDDWVDSENLAIQVDRLENEIADVVLTDACYEYVDSPNLQPVIYYNSIKEGPLYKFDDLTYPHYGFVTYGPILSTSTYRTQALRDANFKITEKSAYVDMEFNTFSLATVNTVRYYNLDIYRYLIGRVGQTVSKEFWSKKYKQHENIIFNLIHFLGTKKLSERKEIYVIEHLIAPMIDSQVFMYGEIEKLDELKVFLKKLSEFPKVEAKCIKFIKNKRGDSWNILNRLNDSLERNKQNLILVTVKRVKKIVKKGAKATLPYGLIRIYQKKKYNI